MEGDGKDVEAGRPTRIPWFKMVWDQQVVTPEIINWPYDGSGTEEDPYIVKWIDDDPRNPMLFPTWKKWALTQMVAFATLAVAFVSSAYSGGLEQVIIQFHTSEEIVILGISLFVLGFAIGPLMWAPMSELYGRQYLYIGTYAMLTFFNAGAAGSQNIWTLVILRFFAGAFGSSPLTNAGGVIADMFPANERGLAMSLFAASPFLGPVIGPIVGGFAGESIGWRWVEGIMAIFTGVLWIIGTFVIPETYPPVLLRRRATKLSKLSGKVYLSAADASSGKVTAAHAFKTALSRPWILLFREPIVLLLSIYMAIIYGTLYMMFAAFPIVYQEERGWSEGVGGLAFIGVAVGMISAVVYSIWDNGRYTRSAAKDQSGFAPPEARLPPGMVGGVAIPVGLFWFAFTNSKSISPYVSIAAGAPFGFGMVLIFLAIMNYLIDSYVIFAASVLAANAVMRSSFGFAFPLFTTYMFDNLGIRWASAVPAFLALACTPFPFLLYKYGPAIRLRCKYAAEAAAFMEKVRGQQVPKVQQEQMESDDISSSGDQVGVEEKDEKYEREGMDEKEAEYEKETEAQLDQEHEEEIEQEAIDYSYDDETRRGLPSQSSRFRPIRSNTASGRVSISGRPNLSSRQSLSGRESLSGRPSLSYNESPYDIDRVNTREIFEGRTTSRPASVKSGKSGKNFWR